MVDERDDEHAERVRESFDSLHDKVGARMNESQRAALENLRAAAHARDGDALRKGLKDLRDRHGWLYRELAEHPRVANLLDELALLGL
jgi:hypothetical protein